MFFPPAWPDGEYEAIAVTTVQSRGKTQNPQYHQGQNRQFAEIQRGP